MIRFIAPSIAALLLAAGLQAQPLLIAQQLAVPADALCRAGKGKPITLKELAQLIGKYHRVKVVVDDAAFQAASPKSDVATFRVTLPQKSGLRLGTVLHHVLKHDMLVEGTIKITRDSLVIEPGVTQVTQDELKDGPAGKLLAATRISSKAESQGKISDVIAMIEKRAGLPVLVASRQFLAAGKLDIESESVRVPKLANVPAAKFLTDTLAQVNATYHVKLDHILVLPKAKK